MSDAQTATEGRMEGGSGPLSPVVSDLLAIMEGAGTDTPLATGNPAPLPTLSGDGLSRRAQLKQEFQDKYGADPARASKAHSDSLSTKRWVFTNALSMDATGSGDLSGMTAALTALAADHARVIAEVAQAEAKRKQLTRALAEVLPPGASGTLAEGATEAEAKPLFDERDRITGVLAPGPVESPLSVLLLESDKIIALSSAKEAFVTGVKSREALRERLAGELASTLAPEAAGPDDVVTGATPGDVAPMLRERDRIAEVLRTARAIELLQQEDKAVSALRQAKLKLTEAVPTRLQRKAAITDAADRLVAALHDESDPTVLTNDRSKITALLGRNPLAEADVNDADAALTALRDNAADARSETLDHISRRAAFRSRLQVFRDLLDDIAGAGSGIKLTQAKAELEGLESELEGNLWEIKFDAFGDDASSMDDRLHNLRASFDAPMEAVLNAGQQGDENKAAPLVAYLKGAAAAALAEATRLQPFLSDDSDLVDDLTAQQDEVVRLLTPPATESGGKKAGGKKVAARAPTLPGHASITEAFEIVTAMRSALDEAREDADGEAQTRAQLRDGLLARIEPGNPAGLPAGYATILQGRRDAVSEPLGPEMSVSVTDDVIAAAKKAADVFERDLAAAAAIGRSWSASEKTFAAVRAAARKLLTDELDARRTAVLDAGLVAAAASNLPGAVALCQQLADLLTRTGAEAGKSKAAKGTLGTVRVGGGGLDSKTVDEIYDVVGPDAIAGLPPDGLATLASCFHRASPPVLANLRTMVSEGFGTEGRVLAALVRSGDTEGILALAAEFGGDGAKQDRANLRGLVLGGGLAEAPTVLDDLLSLGVRAAPDQDKDGQRSRNAARIKALGREFGDGEGPARMRTLVTDCGLGRPRPETPPRPGVMAEVLDVGLDGDAKKLRALADSFAGAEPKDETDRARFSSLVQDGGFGDRPKALGPLVKALVDAGGIAGGTDALKDIGRVFENDEDRRRLKVLLHSGGISGDTHDASGVADPARTHEHADTLAKVFVKGLGQDPLKLKDFADAFGDTGGHAEECRHMFEAWNEFPEASKGARQPGEKIERLLSGRHFGGNVGRLQTQFTRRMEQIGGADQRKKATRFGPHFDQTDPGPGWQQPQPANNAATGVNRVVMSYILKRHVPTHAQRSMLAASNSYFPVDTTATDLAKIVGDAMAAPGAPGRGGNATVPSNGMNVHIALAADGNVPHCYPSSGPAPPNPKEIATFSRAEADLILDAVEP